MALNFLARKISRAKWEPTPYTGPEGIRADAITGSCLRTQNDTIIENLRGRHVDLINLTMTQIIFLATDSAVKIRQNAGFYLFTKRAVLEKLRTAVNSGRLTLDGLNDKVKLEVLNSL